MPEDNIKVGDVVELKSGGPTMTVESIDKIPGQAPAARCCWFVDDKPQTQLFALVTLEKYGGIDL